MSIPRAYPLYTMKLATNHESTGLLLLARIVLHECGLIAIGVGECVSPEVPVFSGESDPVHIPRCFDRDRIDKESIKKNWSILLSPTWAGISSSAGCSCRTTINISMNLHECPHADDPYRWCLWRISSPYYLDAVHVDIYRNERWSSRTCLWN